MYRDLAFVVCVFKYICMKIVAILIWVYHFSHNYVIKYNWLSIDTSNIAGSISQDYSLVMDIGSVINTL